MNTDGVSLFNSSSFSVWPVYLRINELPPKMRKSKKYRIFAGLWFGYNKPYMRTFLRPLVEEMKKLTFEGFSMIEEESGKKMEGKMAITGGLFDLPAKCLVQETVQFNGYHGCSCCEIEGEAVASNVVFPFVENQEQRSQLRTLGQAMLALETNETVFGIRGYSILGELPFIDIIWNIPYDYMHGIFQGVAKSLNRLWFDSAHSKEPWYLGKDVHIIDKALLSLRPPDEVTRLPRSLVAHRNYFKANECRNWMFYYAPMILNGILPDPYFSHFLLVVNGIFILQKEEITETELEFAEKCLKRFAVDMKEVY
uniref:Uncharacterized protein n=1 Tax=Clytia hemisphaerica TaxID=252671 RepID=A0A7M5XKP2_9CNID